MTKRHALPYDVKKDAVAMLVVQTCVPRRDLLDAPPEKSSARWQMGCQSLCEHRHPRKPYDALPST
jgi:hypothetical protein